MTILLTLRHWCIQEQHAYQWKEQKITYNRWAFVFAWTSLFQFDISIMNWLRQSNWERWSATFEVCCRCKRVLCKLNHLRRLLVKVKPFFLNLTIRFFTNYVRVHEQIS